MPSLSLLPGTRNFPYRDDNKTGGKKHKESEQHLLNINSVTLLTTEVYKILKSGQTKLLRSKIALYMLDTIIL